MTDEDLFMNAYQICSIPIVDVKPWGNATRHKSRKLRKLTALIRTFGQVGPIIVDDQGNLIVGKNVLQAMNVLRRGRAELITQYPTLKPNALVADVLREVIPAW
jgi:hypothetical protein